MIQDLGALTLDNHFTPRRPAADSLVLCFDESGVLGRKEGGTLTFPTWRALGGCRTVYAFSIGDVSYFLGDAAQCEGFSRFGLRELRTAQPRAAAFAGVTGYHLWCWYRDNVYCGRCGKPMTHSGYERAMVCACGNTVYPKLCPAVIVAVCCGECILLTKYRRPGAPWALIAGFAEIGETLEQTVRREVMEECGLHVKNIRYYKSQPWGFSGDLLSGFICECDGEENITLDTGELKEARWFSPEEIDFGDDGVSLTREMIERFRRAAE